VFTPQAQRNSNLQAYRFPELPPKSLAFSRAPLTFRASPLIWQTLSKFLTPVVAAWLNGVAFTVAEAGLSNSWLFLFTT